MKKIIFIIFLLSLFTLISCTNITNLEKINEPILQTEKPLKVYWFIPDGFRADPDLFNIYEWAEEGELPNIKKMMDQGSYGYSIPVFPSHTPVNFAVLLTGTYPKTNGVADGPMHVENRTLSAVAISGFSSIARKVESMWLTAEKQGAKVVVLSIPGSTPPELNKGITVRGRWSWGIDFAALNFETKDNLSQKILQGRASKLFFLGTELTKYLDPIIPVNWTVIPKSYSPPKEVPMEGWGTTVFSYIYDTSDDNIINYDTIRFSIDKKNILVVLKKGERSDWMPIDLTWKDINVKSHMIIKVIKLEEDGFFRVRIFYDTLNKYIIDPSEAAEQFEQTLGPMVDFVDNFPPQLIYYDPEDKITFLEEMNLSFDWHTRAIPFIIKEYNPDMVIHDIYSPNQMLTSRWWTGYIDPSSKRYEEINETEREVLWKEVKDMYKQIDNMVGEILNNYDENSIIVFSSDHGAIPLNKYVNLNNLFAKKGWLKFKINNKTGEPIIDWQNSTVIYLKMDNIYINPNGLGGNWTRGKGQEYEKLRKEVKQAILELEDPETKGKPVKAVVEWENVRQFLDLPEDRVGDLVVANEAGYGWNEEMSEDFILFETPLISGYKQAILADEIKGMWTPFIIMGPGIKKGFKIENPVKQVDQYSTIMKLAGYKIPDFVEGNPLEEIME